LAVPDVAPASAAAAHAPIKERRTEFDVIGNLPCQSRNAIF
jgi:hypothetical protein